MADKTVRTHIKNRHDTATNWGKATFKPMPGELIVYDPDLSEGSENVKARLKIGNGEQTVGELPFVVDKEATDAAIAAVDSKAAAAYVSASVEGCKVILTKNDGTSDEIETQDTNSYTKVTSSPSATSKAYLTGTTSNVAFTGPLIFDPNVYLDTTAGTLTALSFNGTATRATADGSGNNIASTYETKTDASNKVVDMNKEAFLTWGGKNNYGQVGPLTAALAQELSANRIAYLNPAALSFEYATNSGEPRWSTYTVLDEDKVKLVTTSTNIKVGGGTVTPITTNHKTRITLTATTSLNSHVYFRPRKLLINVNNPHTMSVLVESKTGQSGANWATVGTYPITGWPSWNEIDLSSKLTTLGGSTTQTGNTWQLRFTFSITAVNSLYPNAATTVQGIRIFGENSYTPTSNLGRTGHLYSYDHEQNATFPAQVTATYFNGRAAGLPATMTSSEEDDVPARIVNGLPVSCRRIPAIHSGTTPPASSLGKDGDLYVMPYSASIPAIYSGTTVPDHSIGVDGDIYIMY